MPLDRRAVGYAVVFGIPPGVGMAFAVLRVGGAAAFRQAILSGAFVGVLLGTIVLVLAARGTPQPPARI